MSGEWKRPAIIPDPVKEYGVEQEDLLWQDRKTQERVEWDLLGRYCRVAIRDRGHRTRRTFVSGCHPGEVDGGRWMMAMV